MMSSMSPAALGVQHFEITRFATFKAVVGDRGDLAQRVEQAASRPRGSHPPQHPVGGEAAPRAAQVARLAGELGYPDAASWIEEHPKEYAEGVFRGFIVDPQGGKS